MRSTRRGVWTWLLAVVCALVAGFAAGAAQPEAHAQSIATSTIVVPAGGLVFRAADGTPLARLSRGPHGGSFELYDDRGDNRAGPAVQHRSDSYVLDDDDPFRAPEMLPERPGAGF